MTMRLRRHRSKLIDCAPTGREAFSRRPPPPAFAVSRDRTLHAAPSLALGARRLEERMAEKEKSAKKGVLEDKERFGKDEAKEKLGHMGDKPKAQPRAREKDEKN
jgi:hypothetical protein